MLPHCMKPEKAYPLCSSPVRKFAQRSAATVHSIVVQFEDSGKWPVEREAVRKIKTAFLVAMKYGMLGQPNRWTPSHYKQRAVSFRCSLALVLHLVPFLCMRKNTAYRRVVARRIPGVMITDETASLAGSAASGHAKNTFEAPSVFCCVAAVRSEELLRDYSVASNVMDSYLDVHFQSFIFRVQIFHPNEVMKEANTFTDFSLKPITSQLGKTLSGTGSSGGEPASGSMEEETAAKQICDLLLQEDVSLLFSTNPYNRDRALHLRSLWWAPQASALLHSLALKHTAFAGACHPYSNDGGFAVTRTDSLALSHTAFAANKPHYIEIIGRRSANSWLPS